MKSTQRMSDTSSSLQICSSLAALPHGYKHHQASHFKGPPVQVITLALHETERWFHCWRGHNLWHIRERSGGKPRVESYRGVWGQAGWLSPGPQQWATGIQPHGIQCLLAVGIHSCVIPWKVRIESAHTLQSVQVEYHRAVSEAGAFC